VCFFFSPPFINKEKNGEKLKKTMQNMQNMQKIEVLTLEGYSFQLLRNSGQ